MPVALAMLFPLRPTRHWRRPILIIAAAPADEIHESVGVGAHQIPGVEPAVGVEALFATAFVIALHHERPADAQFSYLAGADDLRLSDRRSSSRIPAPACRTIHAALRVDRFVAADQEDAAGFGHAQHVVRSSDRRAGRRGHDRVQLPRRIDDRSRLAKLGCSARCAMPAAKPLVMVGFSASSRSSVAPASVVFEHTSVDPATRWPAGRTPNPPIQKNGELQNSRSSAVKPRISLRLRWCPNRAAWVCTAPLAVLVEPDV